MEENNSVIVGKYKDKDVYLIESGGQYHVSFGQFGHRYWLKALNNIQESKPEYTFRTEDGLEVVFSKDGSEFSDLLKRINWLVEVL